MNKNNEEKLHPCRCCGFISLSEPATGTYEICGICGWEDDDVQFRFPTEAIGANGIPFIEWQANMLIDLPPEMKEYGKYTRDKNWKPMTKAGTRPTKHQFNNKNSEK